MRGIKAFLLVRLACLAIAMGIKSKTLLLNVIFSCLLCIAINYIADETHPMLRKVLSNLLINEQDILIDWTTNFWQEDEFKGRHLAAVYTFAGRSNQKYMV